MSRGIAPGDRRLLWWAGGVGLVLLAGVAVSAPPSEEYSPVPTIFSAGKAGARAAYLLLMDLKYDVQVWEEPPAALASNAPKGLLILADPTAAPTNEDRQALLRFVSGGGRVLFCGSKVPAFFAEAKISPALYKSIPRPIAAKLPSGISRGAEQILMTPESYWGEVSVSQIALYGSNDAAVVVLWRIGKGQVLWWAGATPLTNGGITQAGNLNLFLNSVSTLTETGSATVYWDEYFHGGRTSLLSYFEKTPVVWGAGQILLAGVVLVFSAGRRSGPIIRPPAVSRLSPLEFVDTMGALYQHAGASSIPVDVSYRHLRLEFTRRLGLPAATPDAEIARAAAVRLGLDASEVKEALAAAASFGSQKRKSEREALGIVQRLERLSARLNAPGAVVNVNYREKN